MLKFDDDAQPHEKSEALDWRESYYCNFFAKDSDLCGLFWQGVRPNSRNGEAVFLLFDGQKDIVRSVDFAIEWPHDVPQARRIVGKQKFECVEPWNHWVAEYADGSDTVRVDWRRLSMVCDWDWGELAGGARHFEAAGVVDVEGIVAGQKIKFSGYGERDRAWGPRNYAPIKVCTLFMVQFPDDVALHSFAQLDPATGEYRLSGYMHAGGVTRGLSSFEVEFEFNDTSLPVRGSATFVDEAGQRISIPSFEYMNYLGMGTKSGGAELVEDDYSSGHLGFLSFQRFHRSDGVLGRGMVDYNCWAGQRPSRIRAIAPPLFSKLYEF